MFLDMTLLSISTDLQKLRIATFYLKYLVEYRHFLLVRTLKFN